MDDIVVLETADHMDDGVHFPNVGEELIAQSFPLAGPLDQARDVHELDDRGGDLLGIVHVRQFLQPLIRHRHHSHIGLDGAEGIIGALGAGIGQGVEQSGLADVRQTHDSEFHSRIFLYSVFHTGDAGRPSA